MCVSNKMFECFSLNYLSQREDLDRARVSSMFSFLKCDLSILSEREIISTIVNNELFSKKSGELIRVWATIFKSKKLFEIADGSSLTDIEFDIKLKEFSGSRRFVRLLAYINWKYVVIEAGGGYVADIKGFYEEIAITMAINNSLTVELIEEFDSKGVDWNFKNEYGEGVLVNLCARTYNIDLLTYLLDKEIDVNVTDCYGNTAFTLLCANESVTFDIINLFWGKGVELDSYDDEEATALIWLCRNRSIELDMVKLFLDNEANIGVQDRRGNTAFMTLCKNGACSEDMVKLFLDKGVDLNLRNRRGLSPLDCYIKYGGQNEEILKLLGQN